MSTSQIKEIKLLVPAAFVVPNILTTTTPEENSVILSSAPYIHKVLTEMKFNQKIEELESKLRQAKSDSNSFGKDVVEMEERITSMIDLKLSEINSDITSSIRKVTVNPDPKLSEELGSLSKKTTTLSNQITTLGSTRIDDFIAKVDRIVDQLTKNTIVKSSVVIGEENEKFMESVLIDTFSTPGTGFEIIDKRHFSGDHIFKWCDLTVMVEDKKYKNTVPHKETEKALRDFRFHPECDVLIMASMDSPIRGHETTSGLDSVIYDGRLVLFISNLITKGDTRLYFKQIIQPILLASKCVLLKLRDDPEKITKKFQHIMSIIPSIVNCIKDQEQHLLKQMREMSETITYVHKNLCNQRSHLNSIISVINDDAEAVYGSDTTEIQTTAIATITTTEEDTTVAVKKARVCKGCGGSGHDRRNCPNK